jgi:hypothetical protein
MTEWIDQLGHQHRPSLRSSGVTLGAVAEAPRLITAAEMDRMTPDERAAAVNERIVTDWDDVAEAFRQKVIATAHRLADEFDLHQPR